MMYLKDLGFEEVVINSLLAELPKGAIEKISEHEETITTNNSRWRLIVYDYDNSSNTYERAWFECIELWTC